jgi:hypothetical protein
MQIGDHIDIWMIEDIDIEMVFAEGVVSSTNFQNLVFSSLKYA